jgi:HD-like signal output (HDOD) protein
VYARQETGEKLPQNLGNILPTILVTLDVNDNRTHSVENMPEVPNIGRQLDLLRSNPNADYPTEVEAANTPNRMWNALHDSAVFIAVMLRDMDYREVELCSGSHRPPF